METPSIPDFSRGDGLLPSIAQHHETGQVLMLAWMNQAAWEETLATGKAVYFSRSRGKLWRKGEESGHVQTVREIRVDCDADTILLKVEQVGAACHEGFKSCFFRNIASNGSAQICETRLKEPSEIYSHPSEHAPMKDSPNAETTAPRNQPWIRGIVPPLVTPLLGRDELDQAGLERLLEHVIAGGVQGVFILGTTGEAPSLSYRLRREMIASTCRLVAGRVPVLVGITDTSFVESMNVARVAAEAGATAVVLSTPYYFPAGQTELIQYVEHLAEESPLPIMLYNMPSMTKVQFEIETLKTLSAHKNIIGVKDSGGDLEYFKQLLPLKVLRPDWSILIGPEHLTAQAVMLGGDGGVNGGANIFPATFTEIFAAAERKDTEAMRELQDRIERLQAIYDVGKYASRFIKATKCALSVRGICSDFMAEPFNHFLEPERQRVASILEAL